MYIIYSEDTYFPTPKSVNFFSNPRICRANKYSRHAAMHAQYTKLFKLAKNHVNKIY